MPSTPRQFYDSLAAQYDDMTAFAARLGREREAFRAWAQRYPLRRAADMGCGSGVHAIALAGLGVETTGIDISPEMLDRARAHAAEAIHATETVHTFDPENPRWIEGDFLTPALPEGQDLILCLGNSLPHVASAQELTAVLSHWRSRLSAEGRILIQVLHYDRILRERERIVGVRRAGGVTIVRFYDFTEPRITFNILTILPEGGAPAHSLIATELLPVTAAMLREAAAAADLAGVELFAGLSFDPLTPESRDMLALLTP
jgi:SAM-dependent methyltransferase